MIVAVQQFEGRIHPLAGYTLPDLRYFNSVKLGSDKSVFKLTEVAVMIIMVLTCV